MSSANRKQEFTTQLGEIPSPSYSRGARGNFRNASSSFRRWSDLTSPRPQCAEGSVPARIRQPRRISAPAEHETARTLQPSSRVRQRKLGGAGVSKVHQPARLQSLNFTIPTRLLSQEVGVYSRAFVTEGLREERRKVGPQILREPPFFSKCPEPVAWPEAQVLTSEDGGPPQQSSQWAT